ncbi:unnamed protein product [Mucor hiemalis]
MRLNKTIDFLQTQLEDEDNVDLIKIVEFSQIENRFIFERFFQAMIEEILSSYEDELDLYEWARDVKKDNYEVFDRTPLLCKWLRIERRKLRKTMKYLTTLKLNKAARLNVQQELK